MFSSQTSPSSIGGLEPRVRGVVERLVPDATDVVGDPDAEVRVTLRRLAARRRPAASVSSPQAAATSASTARGTTSVRSHFGMLPPFWVSTGPNGPTARILRAERGSVKRDLRRPRGRLRNGRSGGMADDGGTAGGTPRPARRLALPHLGGDGGRGGLSRRGHGGDGRRGPPREPPGTRARRHARDPRGHRVRALDPIGDGARPTPRDGGPRHPFPRAGQARARSTGAARR